MDTWDMIRSERQGVVDALAQLQEDDWNVPSQCSSWNVRDLVGHMIATGEMTPPRFFAQMAASGFKFNSMVDKDSHRIVQGATTQGLIERLSGSVATRNHPPGPTMAMLGEVVIHGEDVFRSVGSPLNHPIEHVVAVADFYKASNLIVGAKRRIAGVTLRASDSAWSTGTGPEVSGRTIDLVLAMTGRKAAIEQLEGPGVAILSEACLSRKS